MKTYLRLAIATFVIGALSACAPVPRPAVLADADKAANSPMLLPAQQLAPQAFARAKALHRQADEAYARGELSASITLGEQALVAYERAAVTARIARAQLLDAESKDKLGRLQAELDSLGDEQRKLQAEVDALALRVNVLRDAEPVAVSGPTTPEREKARLQASRAIEAEARMLCVAARLLPGAPDSLGATETALGDLEKQLDSQPKHAPIDTARRLRAQCLALLTAARRQATKSTSRATADVVLAELSSDASVQPARDERGLVVALPLPVSAAKLSEVQKRKVDRIAAVAKGHPDYPLMVISSSAPQSRATCKLLTTAGIPASQVKELMVKPARTKPAPDTLQIVLVAPTD